MTAPPLVSAHCLRHPGQSSARCVTSLSHTHAHGLTLRPPLSQASNPFLMISRHFFLILFSLSAGFGRGIFSGFGPLPVLWFTKNRRSGGSAAWFRSRPATATAGLAIARPPSPSRTGTGCWSLATLRIDVRVTGGDTDPISSNQPCPLCRRPGVPVMSSSALRFGLVAASDVPFCEFVHRAP